jgi:peptidylprolyl isomerase
MKHTALILLLAASAAALSAQTTAKPAAAATAPKPAAPAATAAKPAAPAAGATSPTVAAVIKAPASIPQYKGLQKTVFTVALRYQEVAIGTGALAEPNKLYKVHYTGWRAADGIKFDSSYDHPRPPLKDKDGKPVLGEDGKPKLDDPQPMPFAQGIGGAIPGFDQGFAGMRVGGKRRLFIPWQLAYGTRAFPDRGPDHPGIPAKSDLIFDVELMNVADMPPMPSHPAMGAMPGTPRPPPGTNVVRPQISPGDAMHPKPAAPPAPASPATPAAPPAAPATAPPAPAPPASAPPTTPPSAPTPPTAPPPPTPPPSH